MRVVCETLEAVHPPTSRKATKMADSKFHVGNDIVNVYTTARGRITAVDPDGLVCRYDVQYDGSDDTFSGVESAFDHGYRDPEPHPMVTNVTTMLDHLRELAAILRVTGLVDPYEYRDIARTVASAKARMTARASDPGGNNF